MKKIMTAAAALLLGVALAATAQANTMRQSAKPAHQTVQAGTTTAPQIAKKRTLRTASKRVAARRHIASKHGKLMTAKLTRHHKSTQMARLHQRTLRGKQQQSTAFGSSAPTTSTPTLNNTQSTTNSTTAGSGSSMPQDQTLQNQNTIPQTQK
jgi:hypothetical protein